MKSILKILVLGAVPILAVTMAADPALAADGSQMIFQSYMDNQSYISVVNSNSDSAVTVLTQYYNDEMEMVVWYLRVIAAGGNVLVDPFNHTIPTTETNVGDFIMDSGKANSGTFVIAVTAVGNDASDNDDTADSLFPEFLIGDLHDPDSNIDNCGGDTFAAAYSENTAAADSEDCGDDDTTTKNVSDWGVDDAEPIAFNHLTGHFTEAVTSTALGGSDQTASWGGTPTVRAATSTGTLAIYTLLTGDVTAMLAEESAGGAEVTITNTGARSNYTAPSDIANESDNATNRGLNGGSLVLPALHGGGDETLQIMAFLSAADNYGGAGEYSLIAAKTGLSVNLTDGSGGALANPAAGSGPVFGGAADPETPAGTKIIVDGVQVMTDAGDCDGDVITGPWTLGHLTSIVPSAVSGTDDFAGLGADDIDPLANASPGWIEFTRATLTCKDDFGDGDAATGSTIEDDDGVPTTDERTYEAGTLVVEQEDSTRTFVTVGRAVLMFVTPNSSFAASWNLKSGN